MKVKHIFWVLIKIIFNIIAWDTIICWKMSPVSLFSFLFLSKTAIFLSSKCLCSCWGAANNFSFFMINSLFLIVHPQYCVSMNQSLLQKTFRHHNRSSPSKTKAIWEMTYVELCLLGNSVVKQIIFKKRSTKKREPPSNCYKDKNCGEENKNLSKK